MPTVRSTSGNDPPQFKIKTSWRRLFSLLWCPMLRDNASGL